MEAVSQPDNGTQETWVFRDTTPAGRRLFWTLDGPLETAIQVAPSQWYEPGAVMEPYFRPAGVQNVVGPRWHPVSQESLFEPPASSATVKLACLDGWEHTWTELHRECFERDDNRYWERLGRHPDDDISEPSHRYLMHCCRQTRPWLKKVQLEVTSSGAFLTVHEYVSAVHPWLMAIRKTILEVLNKLDNGGPPRPDDTKLIIMRPVSGRLYLGDERKWAQWHRKPHQPYVPRSEAEEEQHRQKVIERHLATSAERIARYFREREKAAEQAWEKEILEEENSAS